VVLARLEDGDVHALALALDLDREARLQVFRGDLVFADKLANNLLADLLLLRLLHRLAGDEVGHHALSQGRGSLSVINLAGLLPSSSHCVTEG